MKKLTIAIVLIAFIALGAPYITGKVAETQIHNIISQLNAHPQENIQAEVLSYQRSVYSSKSSYRLKLPLHYSSLFNDNSDIDIECEIGHGFISIDYQCQLANNPWYTSFVSENFNDEDPISLFGNVNVFGTLDSSISIEEIKNLKVNDDNSINLSKTELNVTTDKNLSSYNISGGTKSFNLTTDAESMAVENIKLGGDLNQLEGGLFVGDFYFGINQMELKDADNTVSIQGLKTTTMADLNGSNIDSKTELTINAMTLANAPFETAKDLNFVATVNGVDKEALIEYQAFSKKLQSQAFNTSETVAEVNPMEMIPILERILAQGFNFSVDLSGKFDDHANLFALNLELLDSVNMTDVMALAYAPQETLNKLNVTIHSNFNKETVNADPKLAASVLDSALFVESSDDYQMNITLGPQIEVNGKTSNIEELIALITATAMHTQTEEVEVEAQ